MEKDLLSTSDIAKLLGISRVAVFKKIKSGEIKAERIGRNFVIYKKDLPEIFGITLSDEKKSLIESAVKKTIKDYNQTLKLLSSE
jgi:excisionase family DNA binding protein